MPLASTLHPAEISTAREPSPPGLSDVLPTDLASLSDLDTRIPQLAKDAKAVARIRQAVHAFATTHDLHLCDARRMRFLRPSSVHLVVTSPPYWTLKRYEDHEGQLGHWVDYEGFLDQLDQVWRQCYDALVPGGRMVCVVGDVCLSRRQNGGRHMVVPLHASIQERCRRLGFDNLAPIIWHKIANANYEASGNGGFLGKPYEPNAIIKNDIEFILMQRKPGGYRKPASATRLSSLLAEDEQRQWFQQIWTGVTGASTRDHPAPFPVDLVERLVRMFSFVGDTVLDPFMGSGSTNLAAFQAGRNSIGVELVPRYFDQATDRLDGATRRLFNAAAVRVHRD